MRIVNSDKPGYAVIEYNGARDGFFLSLSLRSPERHRGEYLTPEGLWQEAPAYVIATRISGDAAATRFAFGPEITQYLEPGEKLDIGVFEEPGSWQVNWPAAEQPAPAGLEVLPETAPEEDGPAQDDPAAVAAAVAAAPIAPEAGASANAGGFLRQGLDSNLAQGRLHELTAGRQPDLDARGARKAFAATPAPSRPKLRGLLMLFATVLVLASAAGLAAASWLPANVKCGVFGGALGSCKTAAFTAALECVQTRTAEDPCSPASCLAGRKQAGLKQDWTPDQQGILDQQLAEARTSCVRVEHEAAAQARTCLARNQAETGSCEVRSCAERYAARFPDGEARAELEALAAGGETACLQQRGAAKAARDCAAAKEGAKAFCQVGPACIDPYLAKASAGTEKAELEWRAKAAAILCQGDLAAVQIARACLAAKQAANACDTASCVATYAGVSPDGPSLASLKSEAAAAGQQCQDLAKVQTARAGVESEASRCAQAHAGDPCAIEQTCLPTAHDALPKGVASAALDQIGATAAAACATVNAKSGLLSAARACAAAHKDDPCSLDAACLAPARAASPGIADAGELAAIGAASATACQAIKTVAEVEGSATTCAKARAAKPCSIEQECLTQAQLALQPGSASAVLVRLSGDAVKACASEAAAKTAAKAEAQRLAALDAGNWAGAQACAQKGDRCAAKACFEAYLGQQKNGQFADEARVGADDAAKACAAPVPATTVAALPPVPDGQYSGFAHAACGERGKSVSLTIKGGQISWDFGRAGQPALHWQGAVDGQETINAAAAGTNYRADGSFPDVQMHFPNCEVGLRILNQQ